MRRNVVVRIWVWSLHVRRVHTTIVAWIVLRNVELIGSWLIGVNLLYWIWILVRIARI